MLLGSLRQADARGNGFTAFEQPERTGFPFHDEKGNSSSLCAATRKEEERKDKKGGGKGKKK